MSGQRQGKESAKRRRQKQAEPSSQSSQVTDDIQAHQIGIHVDIPPQRGLVGLIEIGNLQMDQRLDHAVRDAEAFFQSGHLAAVGGLHLDDIPDKLNIDLHPDKLIEFG